MPVQKLIGDVLFESSAYGRMKRDFALQNELLTALSPLKRKWKLDCWTDAQITAGVDWEKSIMGELAEADLLFSYCDND